jgi:hypothetical protein
MVIRASYTWLNNSKAYVEINYKYHERNITSAEGML